ncbi:MAG: ClpXP protease specificity-enhancing factor [Wenzhouxiangellaceae bacterium]
MSSSRPYLLRALYEWIVDNGLTPQILIDAQADQVQLPPHLASEAQVVLNISPTAVRDLAIDNEFLSFVARFSGVSHGVLVPIDAVQAIYARENGHGMMFQETGPHRPDPDDCGPEKPRTGAATRSPHLKVIK